MQIFANREKVEVDRFDETDQGTCTLQPALSAGMELRQMDGALVRDVRKQNNKTQRP